MRELDRIGSADIGHRVVIRRRLAGQLGPTGGPAYSDILGILEQLDQETVRVRGIDDTLVDVPVADVARAKRVPPAPPPRPAADSDFPRNRRRPRS